MNVYILASNTPVLLMLAIRLKKCLTLGSRIMPREAHTPSHYLSFTDMDAIAQGSAETKSEYDKVLAAVINDRLT